MSHFTLVTTKITKKSALIEALRKMGFKDYMIECSDEKMTLKGYGGDDRAQKANIRIKGSGWGYKENYVGAASNDIGFELMEDGSYSIHISEYDLGKYNKGWQTRLINEYSRAIVHEAAEEMNFFVENEEDVDGEIRIQLSTMF